MVRDRIASFKGLARDFYFDVLLTIYPCPVCGGRMKMTGQSQCTCRCGNSLDPTVAFQKSSCCGAEVVRRTCHYACSRCHKIMPSRFLFDERLFDGAYFVEMMRESRKRATKKREEIKRLLAESRSGPLPPMEEPSLESIPGLIEDLTDFIYEEGVETYDFSGNPGTGFQMDQYRQHILSVLGWNSTLFSDIDSLVEDRRKDRIWRFVTLVFMYQSREVQLTQCGNDLQVQRAYHETDQ
ncbi:hypothetical protein ACFL0Q_07455 [Thermodesulfobacteriota bacterium]